ncbi:unnamed protein product [Rangifer tarandus platyrhynchus]|uniref:Uncharacterized protein n=2 Tax=Rangifer tarandus platyrhynchus TaxID=3082113 RepID=A0AC59YMS2_RANTA|nr:unnamed protein product [Rangifer tarandus platyrhynchus]
MYASGRMEGWGTETCYVLLKRSQKGKHRHSIFFLTERALSLLSKSEIFKLPLHPRVMYYANMCPFALSFVTSKKNVTNIVLGKGIKVFSEVSQIVGGMCSVTYVKRISSTIYRLNSSLYPRIILDFISCWLRVSLLAQMVKNPPAGQETWV